MIKESTGSIFDSGCFALVNPVNCLGGVCGKGLALEFKNRFPGNYEFYRGVCEWGEMEPGDILLYEHSFPKIVNFATKYDWRKPSRIEWIERGIDALVELCSGGPEWRRPKSIAVPALGCGLGGLKWGAVKGLMHERMGKLSCDVVLFPPKGKA